jgi:hypothetical protein
MSYQARYIGLDEVLEAFQKKAKTPYFSMWIKGQPLEQYNGDEMDEAIEMITEEINLNKKRGVTHEIELYLHPKKEKIYDRRKSDKYAVIGFRSFELPGQLSGAPVDQSMYNNYALHQELNAIKSQLAALQATHPDEDDEDEESETDGFLNGFNKIIEHPLVMAIASKFLNAPQPVTNLAGVDDNQTLQDTINVLFSKGVELKHLQKLAAMDESKIKMLLTML